MKNLGVTFIIVGLILFFIPTLPDGLIKLIGILGILGGLFIIIQPEMASEYLSKIDFFKKNISKDVSNEE